MKSFTVLSLIFLLLVVLLSFFFVGLNNEQTLQDVMAQVITGLITAFTFSFSFSFLVFNSTIQRYGRESYDLVDKKPLIALCIAFFVCLTLSLIVKTVPSSQNVSGFMIVGRITLLLDYVFFASIIPYFFWLVNYVSSKFVLESILKNLKDSVLECNEDKGELHLKVLLETVFRVIDEHDYATFDSFIIDICKVQSTLTSALCKTPLDNSKREALTSIWISLARSMGMIAEKAFDSDVSYLDDISDFCSEKLKTLFSSEASYGASSPSSSKELKDMDVNPS